jgi:hypothetical protein
VAGFFSLVLYGILFEILLGVCFSAQRFLRGPEVLVVIFFVILIVSLFIVGFLFIIIIYTTKLTYLLPGSNLIEIKLFKVLKIYELLPLLTTQTPWKSVGNY